MTKYTATSLFSGMGGIDLAASMAGFEIKALVEIDEWCRKVLKHHAAEYWPQAEIHTDVRGVGKHNLRRTDIIYGGFPCQPFSISGSRKGSDDSRNGWPEFKRIIGELKPRAVILENVPAICNPYTVEKRTPHPARLARIRRRQALRPAYALTVIKDLSEMGYECRWGIVSAKDAGAAHLRERWWLVGYAQRGRHEQSQGEPRPQGDSIGDGARDQRGRGTEFYEVITGGQVLGNASHAGYTEPSTAVGRQRTGLWGEVEPGSEVLEHAGGKRLEGDRPSRFGEELSKSERTGEIVADTGCLKDRPESIGQSSTGNGAGHLPTKRSSDVEEIEG